MADSSLLQTIPNNLQSLSNSLRWWRKTYPEAGSGCAAAERLVAGEARCQGVTRCHCSTCKRGQKERRSWRWGRAVKCPPENDMARARMNSFWGKISGGQGCWQGNRATGVHSDCACQKGLPQGPKGLMLSLCEPLPRSPSSWLR